MHGRWFKNVICMRYTSSNAVNQSLWEPKLKKLQHRPIKPAQKESVGFSAVFGYFSPNMMTHELQNFLFLSLTIEEKKLRKNKLKRQIALKSREFAKKEGKKEEDLTKEERSSIKDSVEAEMYKEIDPDESYINAFLDTKNDLLFVDGGSESKAKRLVEWLQRIDEGFTIKNFFEASLEVYLTQWVYDPQNNMPSGLYLDSEATLKHDDKARASFSNQDLSSDELITLINHDKKVMELALIRDGRLKFKLKSDGTIRKLKPTDMLSSEIDRPENITSVMQDFEADWLMMANELTKLYGWFETIFKVNQASGTNESENVSNQVTNISQTNQKSAKEVEQESVAQLDSLQFG